MIVPKIIWPSAGANELLFAFPPVGVRPFDRAARRHDTIASSGKRQSLLERTDKFLELDITLVPTEVEQLILWSEGLDNAAWVKQEVTIAADAVPGPLFNTLADRIDPTEVTVNAFVRQDRTPAAIEDRNFVFSVWLSAVGGVAARLLLQNQVSVSRNTTNITVDPGWKRFNIVGTFLTGDTQVRSVIDLIDPATVNIDVFGAQLSYDNVKPYVKSEGEPPADIARWDTFITAVLDGTNFDYYPDAFAAGFTTYVLEDKVWRPKMQIRGRNRFYEFKLRLREFV